MRERRIVAVVLPELPVELARRRTPGSAERRLAVIVDPESAIVAATDAQAHAAGVRRGQGVAAATASASGLSIVHVERGAIEAELSRIAELLLAYAPTASTHLEQVDPGLPLEPTEWPDTAWLDVSGAAQLHGGERALLDGIEERITALGHRPRLAIASGPRIARALALHGDTRGLRGDERAALHALPLEALPLDGKPYEFFRRVGLRTVGELARLPRAQVSARLDGTLGAKVVLGLLDGIDRTPLLAWAPPRVVVEEQKFDDERYVDGGEALKFVLQRMTSDLAERLAVRGEATSALLLSFSLDRSIARLEAGEGASTTVELRVPLPVPLADAKGLARTLFPVVERTTLIAPVVSVRLEAEGVVRARRDQLDLARGRGIDPGRLPRLLAELSSEVGRERVGVFRLLDAHRPESQSRLEAEGIRTVRPRERTETDDEALTPTRLLPEPIRLGTPCKPGLRLMIGARAYAIERVMPLARLAGVEWWTGPVSRDYARVSLTAIDRRERIDALIFFDPATHESFLHGWHE